MRKTAHYVITGTITLRTGMRVGGSDDVLQIGGTDLTCIKDPVTGKPYVPGSSLKGKMRSELEKYHGKAGGQDGNEPCGCAREDCAICRVFGPHKKANHQLGPSRLLVRDAYLLHGGEIELKTEAIIQRQSNTAQHPRTVERVVPGSKFALEIGLQVFDADESFEYIDEEQRKVRGSKALLEVVYHCLDLVEETGIGSGTSKGYGAVQIDVKEVTPRTRRRDAGRPREIAG
jgi:CRISPR-associated protein Csm3